MVLTSMRRPSASVQSATKPTARAGVLLDERTRRKPDIGRPWSVRGQCFRIDKFQGFDLPLAKAKVSRDAATMRIEQLQMELNHKTTSNAILPFFPKLLNAI